MVFKRKAKDQDFEEELELEEEEDEQEPEPARKATARQPEKRRVEQRRGGKEPVRKSAKSDNRFIRYFQDTAVELRKVAWPDRETTIRLTLIVLGTTLFFSIFLGALDLALQQLTALLL